MVLRRLSWVLTVLIVLLLVAGGAVSSLALFAPFHPGDALFSLQYSVEQARLFLISDQTELAERFLDLVERRLGDLEARIGTEHELVALDYLDQAVNQAVLAIDATPPENRGPLLTRLATLALRLENILQRLTVIPTTNPDVYANALAKAEALLNSINTAHARPDDSGVSSVVNLSLGLPSDVGVNPAAAAAPTPVLIAPHPIPFPPNATPGPHDFFPLTGRHATLACADCHANGRYRGTARQCIECHAAAAPVNHFPGSCDTCHSTAAWKPATFNHTGLHGLCRLPPPEQTGQSLGGPVLDVPQHLGVETGDFQSRRLHGLRELPHQRQAGQSLRGGFLSHERQLQLVDVRHVPRPGQDGRKTQGGSRLYEQLHRLPR